jgi:hypothetical protein
LRQGAWIGREIYLSSVVGEASAGGGTDGEEEAIGEPVMRIGEETGVDGGDKADTDAEEAWGGAMLGSSSKGRRWAILSHTKPLIRSRDVESGESTSSWISQKASHCARRPASHTQLGRLRLRREFNSYDMSE